MNIETLTSDLENAIQADWMSPYQLAGILTSLIGRKVHAPMIYQYVGKGWIPSSLSQTGKKIISRDDAIEWSAKYIAKNVLKAEVPKVTVLKESEGSFT